MLFPRQSQKGFRTGPGRGQEQGHATDENLDPLPTLDNALGVQDAVARLIAEVYAGKVHPRIASVLAPLMNLQQRAIEATNLERRLARVEELLADKDELNSTGGAPGANVIQHRKPPRKA